MIQTAIVLQARMGSRRLPGKVLAPIGRRTLLAHCVVRLSASDLPVIVATTRRAEDDEVEAEAMQLGARVFRGDTDDVLSRYLGAARTFGYSHVIRATADNPFVDADAPRRVLDHGRHLDVDHLVECGLPVGAAVEGVRVDALARAAELATDPYDREHVTSLLRRDSRFHSLRAVAPAGHRRPGLRLTVDTAEDLEFVRAIDAILDGAAPPLPAVIAAADRVRTSTAPLPLAARRGA
jgi:spore coat polysaccharide biosynthesis protein SpsF